LDPGVDLDRAAVTAAAATDVRRRPVRRARLAFRDGRDPGGLPGDLLRLPGARDPRTRVGTTRIRRPRSRRARAHRRRAARRPLVQHLGGHALDAPHPGDRHPRRVGALAVRVPRPSGRASVRHRAVRPADGRGRRRVHHDLRHRRVVARHPSRHAFFNTAVVVRTVGGSGPNSTAGAKTRPGHSARHPHGRSSM